MRHPKRARTLIAVGLAAVITVGTFPYFNHAQAAQPQSPSGKVGFLFSDFTTSARWESDKAYFIADLKKLDPHVTVQVADAKNNQTQQETEAKSLLTAGAKVLIDVPVDSTQAKAIVNDAHKNKPKVPVIAYDRLIYDSPVDAYTSFDGFSVGVQQAKFIVKHVKKGGTIVSIAGATTDNNAHLFYKGAMSVLRPLFRNHHFKLGYDKFTPLWDVNKAQQEMAAALTKLNNKVNGVLVANDGMAAGVIAALRAQHLAGKIPVTGQDATVAGLQDICLGYQSMTVYKPLKLLAQAAANVTNAFLHGRKFTSKVKVNNQMENVPSVLLPVETVTKSNIRSTVIKDGFVKKSDLAGSCKGL